MKEIEMDKDEGFVFVTDKEKNSVKELITAALQLEDQLERHKPELNNDIEEHLEEFKLCTRILDNLDKVPANHRDYAISLMEESINDAKETLRRCSVKIIDYE